MFEVAAGGNEPADFLLAQNDREPLRDSHGPHLGHQLAAVEGYVEEELEADDGGIQRRGRRAGVDEVQLIVAQIIDGRRVGRASEILREVADRADVSALRLGAELAYPQVVEHALPQRADASVGCSHGLAPVEEEADCLIFNFGKTTAFANLKQCSDHRPS